MADETKKSDDGKEKSEDKISNEQNAEEDD
jgi:hypothetical protein